MENLQNYAKTIKTFIKIHSKMSIHDVNGYIKYANEMADEYTE